MKYVMRIFFYSVGLALLAGAWALDPATAQFKDMLTLLHSAVFWRIVAVLAVMLAGVDLCLTGRVGTTVMRVETH